MTDMYDLNYYVRLRASLHEYNHSQCMLLVKLVYTASSGSYTKFKTWTNKSFKITSNNHLLSTFLFMGLNFFKECVLYETFLLNV